MMVMLTQKASPGNRRKIAGGATEPIWRNYPKEARFA